MKITEVINDRLNPYAEPSKDGYDQPEYTILFDTGDIVVLHDLSCGDFGTRIYAAHVSNDPDRLTTYAAWGTMLSPNENYSFFTDEHKEILSLIETELGYRIPTEEEIANNF